MIDIKAFGYLRVSGKGQLDGDGFPRQRQAIRAYAEAHGYWIDHWFEERAVSGANDLAHRPALQELLTALHADGTKHVMIEKLDRLARDLMVQESILADFKRNGFSLISVAEPDLCSDDPSRKLMRQMMGAFSEYEKCMIVSKLRAARQRIRAREGRCEGRKPFGAKPGERETLKRMYDLYAQGAGYKPIAAALNEEGYLTRNQGSRWHPASVRRILLADEGALSDIQAREGYLPRSTGFIGAAVQRARRIQPILEGHKPDEASRATAPSDGR